VNGDGYSDVIVSAPMYDNGQTDEGKAFVYHGSASGLALTSNWTAESYQAGALFGWCVSSAGDVNGDGYSDVIVGAHNYDNGQTDEGRAFVYHGSASGLPSTPNWTAESDQAGALFGWCVSSAGDVNGDGYSDVIVGAYQYDNGETNEGRVFLYYGSANGLSSSANWTCESNQAGAFYGISVSTAGDINGDGYSDVIVGAYAYDNGQTDEGRTYVYHGSSSGLPSSANWTAESNLINVYFGRSVSSAGDVNGDGYSDVIIGAHGFTNPESNEGKVFVYHGSGSGLQSSPNWSAESNQTNAYLGVSVSTAGDVNGDGYSDVIVGAYLFDNGETDEGMVWVFNGSISGLSNTYSWSADGNQISAQLGSSVSTAGDINGDGYSDVIVGAPFYDGGQTDEGRALVYTGSSNGLIYAWYSESDQASANYGSAVSTAGDVNGDGYSDVIVGANNYDNTFTDEGRVLVFYGNGGAGKLARPMQYRNDKYTRIAPGLKTRSTSDMVIGLVPNSYFSRGIAKLQVEVKQLGTPFNGSNLTETPNWYNVGLYNNEIKVKVAGLQENTFYKWRARLMYDITDGTPQKYTRWFYGPGGLGLACFQVSNNDNPLPIQLQSFKGVAKVNNVLLDWITGKEYNNAGFQVEGMKADSYSTNWEAKGFVQGMGNTNEPTVYKFEDRNKNHGVYLYRLKQIDLNGNFNYYYLNSSISVGVPEKFELTQNYPNPFNPVTKITFAIPNDSRVTLKIYDITGREVKTLINSEVMTADWYTREFSSSGLASGVYFYRLTADGINKYTAVKKMMLIK
jgi:hypothetical protein